HTGFSVLSHWFYDLSINSSGGLTSMCSRVKITGSVINTRLDSLLIEAEIICEFTATEWFCLLASLPNLIVAFSVLRNCPRFL
uniref:Uncharacterized protein n=1 Tax=Paramormyrops kingsleyae TaxID=1676925 RepID=A0A3B3QJC1_9TELE